ncbi:MAG: hypothetical protein NTX84_09490 [Nitrospirae bacterium]|nr:hypothetical protein [Nitrospirota bacterium]
MSVADILLKYLSVLLAWPPVVGIMLLYFLGSQREAIGRLIDRIAEIVFPGGSLKLPLYEGEDKVSTREGPEILLNKAPEAVPPKEEAKVPKSTGDAFLVLITNGLSSNQSIIAQLLDRIWIKSNLSGSQARPPEGYLNKVDALAGVLDRNVIRDLRRVESALRGDECEKLTTRVYIYNASQKLIWYLTEVANRSKA